jgi:hypothetical protein
LLAGLENLCSAKEQDLENIERRGVKGTAAMPTELLSIQPGELKFPCMFHIPLACF